MEKIIKVFLLIGSLFVFASHVHAADVAGSSAQMQLTAMNIKRADNTAKIYRTKIVMKKVLERYNSPMVSEVDSFINACQKYDLDCYLLPSIAGLESTFGQFIWPNSYNAFGWGGGYIMFDNWDQGIDTVAKGLRENYINRGANNIYEIGHIYSESPTWAVRVDNLMSQFKKEEDKLPLFLSENKVEL
jgi:hypothetical protein